jgi:hypothetical protein
MDEREKKPDPHGDEERERDLDPGDTLVMTLGEAVNIVAEIEKCCDFVFTLKALGLCPLDVDPWMY